jgi:hypothetical protein
METPELIVDDKAAVIYDTQMGMTIFTEAQGERLRGGRMGPTQTEKDDPLGNDAKVAFWGTTNLWPQQVVAEVNDSDLLRPLIRKQAKRMIGQGLVYGTTTVDENTGEERMKVMRVLEIERWLRRTNIDLFLYEAWCDWLTYGNVFAELQMTYDGRVAGLYCQDATRCRLSTKEDNGRILHCYLSGKWGTGAAADGKDTFKIPALDPYYDTAGQVRNSKAARAILPIRLLVDDQDYYGQAPWHGLIRSGWLEVARAIPKLKKHLMQNMMLVRYHVEIGKEYWDLAYPGFKDLKPEEKKKKKEETVTNFTKWATGVEKAGRTLLTEMLLDDVPGVRKEYRSLWKITPLKLEIPTGAYVEDSAEVDAKIIRAFMDSSLFGQTPSKDRNSAGSGSDKRIAHTHELLDNQADSQLLLSPLDLMAEVNGWHDTYGGGQLIKFWFKSYHSATLDRTLGAVSETPDPQKPSNA